MTVSPTARRLVMSPRRLAICVFLHHRACLRPRSHVIGHPVVIHASGECVERRAARRGDASSRIGLEHSPIPFSRCVRLPIHLANLGTLGIGEGGERIGCGVIEDSTVLGCVAISRAARSLLLTLCHPDAAKTTVPATPTHPCLLLSTASMGSLSS